MKKLVSIENKGGILTAVFNISHCNETTTVEQDLILQKTIYGWTARMEMDGFPELKTVTCAAWKLGDWLERLGSEIKEHTYDSINLNDV